MMQLECVFLPEVPRPFVAAKTMNRATRYLVPIGEKPSLAESGTIFDRL